MLSFCIFSRPRFSGVRKGHSATGRTNELLGVFMFSKRAIILAITLVLSSFQFVVSQSRSIDGRVEDAVGAPIAGAAVAITNKRTGLQRIVLTDPSGRFQFTGLDTDEFQLTVRAAGFAVADRTAKIGETGIVMTLEIAAIREAVTVVSGSRQVELQGQLNTAVEVVSRQEIVDKGYQTVGDVLKEVPGVQTRLGSDTGTVSGIAGEQIQGVGSRQALVLVDGFPVVAARGIKSGTINLDRQSTGKIEQIEVVKGAASALYGSDAIGGVINLITREPSRPLEGRFTVSGGSIGALSTNAEFGLKRAKYSGFFTVGRDKQNEFDLTPNTFDTTGAGFHRYDIFAKQKYEFTSNFYVSSLASIYMGRAKGRSIGEPDPTQNYASGKQFDDTRDQTQTYGLTANWTPDEKTVIQGRGFFSRYDEYSKTSFANGTSFPDDNLFQRFGRVDGSVLRILGERQIVQFGGEWVTDRYRGINRLANNEGQMADTSTFWAQDKVSLTTWATLTAGVRYDRHSVFGSAVSPKIGLSIRAGERMNIHASWGRGFRAPDLGQLYYKFYNPTNFYQVFGNPTLSPEHSGSWQVGANYSSTKKTYRFGLNLFRNDIVNLIDANTIGFVLPFPSTTPGAITISQAYAYITSIGLNPAQYPIRPFRLLLVYNNISKIYTEGIEASADFKLPKKFIASGSYTYLNARNKATNAYLPERIKNQGMLRLGYDDADRGFRADIRASFYSAWKASSQSNRVLQGEMVSPAFRLVDVSASKTIRAGFSVYGMIENLFDNRDANIGKVDSHGQPLPIIRPDFGRMFRTGIRYNFGRGR